MTKKCLTCVSSKKAIVDTDKEIPLWYKKMGNYSLLPKALNCNDKYNPNKNELKKSKPMITDTELEVEVDIDEKKKRWIYYWATMPSEDSSKILSPEKAYQNEKNAGLTESDDQGNATLLLNCP